MTDPARPIRKLRAAGILSALMTLAAYGQHPREHPAPNEQQQQHHEHAMPADTTRPADEAGLLLMEQGSGTSANPASSPMHMAAIRAGSWSLMAHAQGHIAAFQQTGPRGGDKFFSTNWVMGMAERRVGQGSLLFRAMLSLEPATVTHRRYPLLFQTGETAFGRALVDGQHPHDLVMEIGVHYAQHLGEKTILSLYFAPVGDPALGPVGFPHRVSAMELPQAPLGHHVQDSTHIVNEVITAGIKRGAVRLEASGFHGAEPNENRWNIDHGAIDSWAARLTLTPTRNLSAQASVGRLSRPEALEADDIIRSTASITYNRPLRAGHWASSLIWGRNHKTVERNNINAYAVESLLQVQGKSYLTGRMELVDRDELFNDRPAVKQRLEQTVGSVFRVAAYTLGYTRDINMIPGLQTGLGGNFTLYTVPHALKEFYGQRPAGFLLYLRFRLKGAGHHAHSP